MSELWLFVAVTVPAMILLGVRHAFDIDHITAIDNLVRMRNAAKSARWVGSAFSLGHTLAVCLELVVIVYLVTSLKTRTELELLGGLMGAAFLIVMGAASLYGTRRYGQPGSAVLARRIERSLRGFSTIASALIVGFVFGLGFDTASQVSLLIVSAFVSAAQGIQAALILVGFFALGMIPSDTLDSFVLRETFSKIAGSEGYRAISYALAGAAISLGLFESWASIAGLAAPPIWSGPVLTVVVVGAGATYYRSTRQKPESTAGTP